MKTKCLIWFCVVFSAAVQLSAATAMGKKPPMEESTSAKTTANTASISVEVLYRDQQCGVLQAQTRWIETQQAYQTLFSELRKSYISNHDEQPPPVDFSQNGVLLVAMGQRNTGGYAVDFANSEAVISAGVLRFSVNWREPRKGMMVTQALTSPCMLLKTPKAEFERIEIKDQNGVLRLSGER